VAGGPTSRAGGLAQDKARLWTRSGARAGAGAAQVTERRPAQGCGLTSVMAGAEAHLAQVEAALTRVEIAWGGWPPIEGGPG
jgi:hypothetical protein